MGGGRAFFVASYESFGRLLAPATTRLTKRYGQRSAVGGIGLVAPTSGEGHVLGAPLNRPEAYLGRVGALIEGPAFHPQLSGEDDLRVSARLGGIDRRRVAEVLARVELSERAGERFGTYSLGTPPPCSRSGSRARWRFSAAT